MLTGIATDDQATRMVTSWLTNKSRFCVPGSPTQWPAANTSGCYWGVPSISADDPDYLVPGGTSGIYWRGETWQPQVYLVYQSLLRYGISEAAYNCWGLRQKLCVMVVRVFDRYDHIPVVRNARLGLCAQQKDLFLTVWNATHHVCENYPSTLGATVACTGNNFYMVRSAVSVKGFCTGSLMASAPLLQWGGLAAFINFVEFGYYAGPNDRSSELGNN